jgi:hypothetical protein
MVNTEDSPKSATSKEGVDDGISGSHATQSSTAFSPEAVFRIRPESTAFGGVSISTPGAVAREGLGSETCVLSSMWSSKQNRTRLKIKYRIIGAAPKALMRAR